MVLSICCAFWFGHLAWSSNFYHRERSRIGLCSRRLRVLLVLQLGSAFRTGKLCIRLLCVLLSLFLRMFGTCRCFAGVLSAEYTLYRFKLAYELI